MSLAVLARKSRANNPRFNNNKGCFNLNNLFSIDASGFTGAVLQSYIWKSTDVLNTFKTIQLNIQKLDEATTKATAKTGEATTGSLHYRV